MSRAERLLALMQVLRRHRAPVSGASLAAELGISLRTLYRDIASLQAQGADIQGEAGVGYVLRPGFLLPPQEVESLVLGARWVAQRSRDSELAESARNVVAKIASVLPRELRHELDGNTLFVGAPQEGAPEARHLAGLRTAIRNEQKVRIGYRDARDRDTARVIWPFALGFFEETRVVAAWCETREGFRHFRADRITALEALPGRYPDRRQSLLKRWRQQEGIPAASL
jgi:predicted DNA-binding transcriptional regulator YafY